MPIRQVLIVLYFLTATYFAGAQEYNVNVQQFGIEEGLTYRDVFSFKDSYGFIWIGSREKILQRYDGHEFKTYELPGSITNSSRIIIGQDSRGWITFFSNMQFVFIHPITGEMRTGETELKQEILGTFEKLKEAKISFLASSSDNEDMYSFVVDNQLISIDIHNSVDTLNLSSPYAFEYIFLDSKKRHWVSNKKDGIWIIDSTGTVQHKFNFRAYGNWFSEFISEYDGNVYFNGHELGETSKSGLFVFQNEEISKLPNQISPGYQFRQAFGFRSWTTNKVDKSVEVINHLDGSRIRLDQEDYKIGLFGVVDLRNFIAVNETQSLISTDFGFNILDIKKSPFTNYFVNTEDEKMPLYNSIRGIYADSSRVIFNCEFGGIVEYDLNEKINIKYRILHQGVESQIGNELRHDYSGKSIMPSKSGGFWTNHNTSTILFDSTFKDSLSYKFKNSQFYANELWAIYPWKNDGVLAFCSMGIEFIDSSNTQSTVLYRFDESNIIHQAMPKSDHEFWLCSQYSLMVFDTQKNEVTATYNSTANEKYYLPAEIFYSMHEDEEGDLWFGTNNGLLHLKTDGFHKLYNRQDGLTNENIYGVLEDDYGRLWLSSDYGIMSFHKESKQILTYTTKEGVAHNEFNRISFFKAEDGTMYFGGINGVTSFHPKDFVISKNQISKPYIIELDIYDGDEEAVVDNLKNYVSNNEITFEPNDKYLKLKFVSPSFDNSGKAMYAWKIKGIFDEWTYQKENTLQFGALAYGNHNLQIKCQNAFGGWSDEVMELKINVLKPFYLQTWFILLALCFLIAGVVSFFKIRTAVLKKEIRKATLIIEEDKQVIEEQSEQLKKLDKLKTQFFTNVSHELRTPLTLMIGPINRLKKSARLDKDEEKMLDILGRNTTQLKSLVNEILDLSKLEDKKMGLKAEPLNLSIFLNNLLKQYHSFGSSEDIEFIKKINIDENVNYLIDQRKFEKIINNLLSNAIKFTPAKGKVTFIISQSEGKTNIVVRDTGRGIHPDELEFIFDRFYQSKHKGSVSEGGTGIGLSLTRELTQLMGGTIKVESELSKGTAFFLTIPFEQTNISTVDDEALDIIDSPISKHNDVDSETKNHKNKTILVVEDNLDLREYQNIILSDYNVILTEHGQEALDYLAKGNLPDLIISDLMMPVMDGLELIANVKANDSYRHLPFIMLTAKTNQQVKIKALRCGIDDYMTKPFDEEELKIRIENLFDFQNQRNSEKSSDQAPVANQPNSSKTQLMQEDLDWLENLESYILDNLHSDLLSVSSIAQAMLMSESTLLRQLKNLTGMTPGKYLTELRLNQAREFLLNKSYKTVSIISSEVGFKDASSFSRTFKKRFGKSPREFQNG